MFSLNSKQFHFRFLVTMLRHWIAINSNHWRLFRTSDIFERKQLQMLLETIWINRYFVKLLWMQLSNQDEYIDQIRSWHFFNANLFIINRFEHIESKKSIVSTFHNTEKIFVIFVQMSHSEKTTSNKTQIIR